MPAAGLGVVVMENWRGPTGESVQPPESVGRIAENILYALYYECEAALAAKRPSGVTARGCSSVIPAKAGIQ